MVLMSQVLTTIIYRLYHDHRYTSNTHSSTLKYSTITKPESSSLSTSVIDTTEPIKTSTHTCHILL